jgi:hypothetical protein
LVAFQNPEADFLPVYGFGKITLNAKLGAGKDVILRGEAAGNYDRDHFILEIFPYLF